VCVGYLVLAWVVIQVTDSAVPALHLPNWVNSLVFYFGLIGFPFALFFAWVFEMTPEGVKRQSEIDRAESISHETGRKLDYIIIGLLLIGGSYFFWESRFSTNDTQNVEPIGKTLSAVSSTTNIIQADKNRTTSIKETSIAVLPFVDMSPQKDQEYFSDGMSEEILNSLVKIPKIKVAGRTSSFAYKGKMQTCVI